MLNRIGPSALGVPWPKRLGKQTPLHKLMKTKLMINDNNYALDHPAEQTILQPKETSFRVEAWLEGTNFVQTQHPEEDFRLSSHCYSNQDHQIVAELLEQAMTTVRLNSPPWTRKDARNGAEDRRGAYLCSQLFAPKLNIELEHPSELYGKQVSLALHCREDPTGLVHLQCDYIDCYAPIEYPDVASATLVNQEGPFS